MTTRLKLIAVLALIKICLPIEVRAGGAFMFDDDRQPSRIEVPPPRPRPRAAVAASDRRTEAATPATCTECSRRRAGPVQAPAKVYPVAITFRTRGKSIGPACRSQFMNGNGEYGPVGRKIASLISSNSYKSRFLNGSSLRGVCPRFSRLSTDQQAKAWVWFWMVLANEESTCNVNLRHATHYPDGRVLNPKPGWGLWAAELYPQHRAFRGRMCAGNIREPATQVNCAVDTMASTQLSRGRGVLWPGSYWGPVRRAGRQIMPNMRGFKSCF